MENFKIIFNGSTGSIGSYMPRSEYINPLQFRIEDDFNSIFNEINSQNADVMIHLAGLVNIEECENNPLRCYNINVEGSEKIFKAAAKAGIKRFIYTSTAHVYEMQKKLLLLDTNAKVNPKTVYAKSKLLTEEKLLSLSKKYPNIKISIARIFSVLSKLMRKDFLLTTLYDMAKTKEFKPIKGLNNVRDFLWANDVCKKLIELSYSKAFPPIVNICSGQPKKISEIVKEVFKIYEIDNSEVIELNDIEDQKNYLVGIPTKFK